MTRFSKVVAKNFYVIKYSLNIKRLGTGWHINQINFIWVVWNSFFVNSYKNIGKNLLQHIIGGLRFSCASYVRTSVCVTGIRKKERENKRALSTTTYNSRIEIFLCVANVSQKGLWDFKPTDRQEVKMRFLKYARSDRDRLDVVGLGLDWMTDFFY